MYEGLQEQIMTLRSDSEEIQSAFNEERFDQISGVDAMFAIVAAIERLSGVVNEIAEQTAIQTEIMKQLTKSNASGLNGIAMAFAEANGL